MGIRYLLACLCVRFDSVLFAMVNYILSFWFSVRRYLRPLASKERRKKGKEITE